MVNHDRYASIKNVFKRDHDTLKVIKGNYSLPQFDYLQDCQWTWTEKLEGMNVRAILDGGVDFRGRSDNARMPGRLVKHLRDKLDVEAVREETNEYGNALCLYGEGVGAGIPYSGKYGPNQFFVMFDAQTDYGWASQRDVEDIAARLNIPVAPTVCTCTLKEAIKIVQRGRTSFYGDFFAEGLVGKPVFELQCQYGNRIIVKVKHRDFYQGDSA